jgi:hypothetical protein
MEHIRVFDNGSVIAQVSDETGETETFIIVAEVDVNNRVICVGYRSDILSGPAELFERFESDDGETYYQPIEDEALYHEIEEKLWAQESEDEASDSGR